METFEGFLREEQIGHYVLLRIPMMHETSVFHVMREHLPENWTEFYMARSYHLIDPVLRNMVMTHGFYRFEDAHLAFEKDTNRRGIERLADDRKRFGIEDGYLFPVYGRLGLVGAVVLAAERRSEVPSVSLHMLNAALMHLFWRFVNLSDDGSARLPPTERTVSMTRREKEVLALLADGLTSNEIARQLSISNHTVDWYVNGLQEKLDARNRQHAISLAFRRGLLS
ncbi:LuxR family transcriptional regulator [Rhizobiaceae bacterium BDR2-2]|uniref:LuxR family transcriptional regulator n=1 Tax=Ectorhizobium quercum TaxID=2965071 RepID=A0AAE3N3K1_9HYPH|nr:LuxR family transcriptional regulator [Ectorhizobium quercum]MCX8999271.1 LuxR family transcriptional regulator [Ectorhizobium quercum]